ncbi:hypothetical protein [Flavobacterium solisilvae]|uniref:DUF4221 domain-containing protein n=1 Tax=Flavobacterium solisilvae TaxID=1852019 RepID=A0ABX1QUC0_9FLAO|nr:hypothetical protein [Flavobacterium solisilvae]NMH25090.1 hypothetical protein [Flavobacterium solisilvae]
MKKLNIMHIQLIYVVLVLFVSCDKQVYYKTFDYKTMTFVEPTEKTDHCVRFISQTKDKIELEVMYNDFKIKRTFLKKENYWYSKFKYEEPSFPKLKVAYGGIHELHYYIFEDHVVYKDDAYLVYVDLINNKMYLFDELQIEDYKYVTLKDLQTKEYDVVDYYVNFDTLYERDRGYDSKGNLLEEVINNHSNAPLLDIFFWMDEDIYYLGATKVPIYD